MRRKKSAICMCCISIHNHPSVGYIYVDATMCRADFAMNLVLVLMVLFKVITVKSALVGYGNSGLMTVVVLFIVAQGITSTGGAEWIVSKLLGAPSDIQLAQVRMCLITAVFSSFVNGEVAFQRRVSTTRIRNLQTVAM
jgi:di/tricarboxylate transporter